MSIAKLQAAMLKMPQAEVETNHHLADGLYAREMVVLAGTLIIGKVHKRDHFIFLLSGEVEMSNEDGTTRLVGPAFFSAKAGTKRALYFLEDSVWFNVHRTQETDMESIENDLVEYDPASPFLPGNTLRKLEQL